MLFDGNKVSKIVKNVDRIFHVYLNLEGIMKYDNYNSKKIKRIILVKRNSTYGKY